MVLADKTARINCNHLDKIFVNGAWLKPSSSDTISVTCPATQQVIFKVADANEADVDAAVTAARQAFDKGPWPKLSLEKRLEYLTNLAAELRKRGDDLAYAWTEQVGILHALSKGSLDYSVGCIDRFVDVAHDFPFIEEKDRPMGAGYLVREPVGVVAAIAPWNAPLIAMLNKVAPALLAGCTVVMKPAPETPLDAYIVAECAHAAGFPPGVINLLVAGRDVSEHLVKSPGVDKVSFTGSVKAGKRIASLCGERIARVTLELGGKSAAIVCEDYDLDAAAASIAGGIVMLAGQNCAALTRAIVPQKYHDAFVEKLGEKLSTIKIGDPYDPDTQLGPLAMKRQLDQVLGYIEKGKKEGATLSFGGNAPDGCDTGYYIQPTVFSNVDNQMTIAQEEIFGPVLCVIPCEDQDHAIEIANASDFGLAGAVYTNSAQRAFDMARKIRTGTVGQNGPLTDFNIGFGGFKQSGLGREGGLQGIYPYTEAKTILLAKNL